MTRFTRREFIRTAGGFVSAAALAPELLRVAEAAEKDRFNILFLMTDQHNHSVMGCAGNPIVKTPNLDRLANEGARFTNAICATPFCSPTRASLITGRWPHTHGVVTNVKPRMKGLTDRVVATEQLLFDKGYQTSQMGKWHLGEVSDLRCYRGEEGKKLSKDRFAAFLKGVPRDGWPKPREGEVRMEDEICGIPEIAEFHKEWLSVERRSGRNLCRVGRLLRPREYTFESWLADRCIDLIKKHRDKRFMMTWSVGPPHAPWIAPEPYYSMYNPAKMPLPPSWNDHPTVYRDSRAAELGRVLCEKGVREYLRCYYGQVTMVDWCVGRILDALAKEGLERNTLVLYLSDHGDMQAGHGMVGKSVRACYEETVRVPLIIRYPRAIKVGTVIDAHANSVDIMPTLLDYAGQPIPKGVQGRSLKPLLEGQASDDDRPGFCERGKGDKLYNRMIRTGEWKYTVFSDGRRELFDLEKDPHEMSNLADSSGHKSQITRLHKQLTQHMEETDDPALETFPNS